jgi:hypothetical protein
VPAAIAPPSPPPVPAAPDDTNARDQATFDALVRAREQCGESTADMNRELFLARLRTSRADLIAKHQVKDVRYEVYIRDGRSAMRAVFVRDEPST